jgi:UDP-N-acetylglucosamine acyltransferase
VATQIHPTALVDPRARIGADVAIGPYTVVDGDVEIGDGTTLGAHNVVTGHTRIGRGNRIYHFCSIGEVNQDKKYQGEPTRTEIGDGNTIREYCSINRGTVQGGGLTRLGDGNWIMAYVHIAHDCLVGNNTVFANNASLAGHVVIDDWVTLGGFVGVHQFVKVGAHVMAGVASVVLQDVPPYVTIAGNPCAPHGVNSRGLERRGFSPDAIAAIKRAYRTLYRSGLTLGEARAQIERQSEEHPELKPMADFLASTSRGVLR